MVPHEKVRSALVLAGGGTRGAYEAGVIHYLRTMLPPDLLKAFHFHIQCGSSVGAINTVYMAATAGHEIDAGNRLLELWKNIQGENIYRRGPFSFGKFLLRTTFGLGMHVVGLKGIATPEDRTLNFQSIFETQPFIRTLRRSIPWAGIAKNLSSGRLDAVTVSGTNLLTGEIELFVQKIPQLAMSERMTCREVRLSPRHVMASAALPFLFPPVAVNGLYYTDGGMRLNTPLAPAVSLGANRILIVGTRYEKHKQASEEVNTLARYSSSQERPTMADILGKFYNAILLDRMEADKDQISRINRILEACAKHVTQDEYQAICQEAKVQRIETISIFPSVDIHTLVDETISGGYKKMKTFGAFERFILRVLEADTKRGRDLLSYFLFEPTYLRKMIDLGFEDARAKHDQLCEFAERSIRGTPVS